MIGKIRGNKIINPDYRRLISEYCGVKREQLIRLPGVARESVILIIAQRQIAACRMGIA
jgi:hypothetical protein